MNNQSWMHGLKLGARQLWRDLRAGELRLLMVSVALAVAALTAVGFLADRMQSGLWRDAGQLLGGDAVVVSDQRTPDAFVQKARDAGLQSNTNVSFPTMARAMQPAVDAPANRALAADAAVAEPPATRLVSLKAVEPGYPLRGRMEIVGPNTDAASPGAALSPSGSRSEPAGPGIPPEGEVWVDAALLEALNMQLGRA
jgi:putative ABC transport system permease protein